MSKQPADGMAHRRDPDSPSLLSAIVNSSDDAIVGKTVDGRITSWNPAALSSGCIQRWSSPAPASAWPASSGS